MRVVYKIALGAVAVWLLSACGNSEKWGIDNGSIPMCNADVNDSSAAILVPADTQVKAIEEGTTLRIWHYSNSDKLICVITGSAVIGGNS